MVSMGEYAGRGGDEELRRPEGSMKDSHSSKPDPFAMVVASNLRQVLHE